MASMKAFQAIVVGSTKRFPKKMLDSAMSLPTPYLSATVYAVGLTGRDANNTDALPSGPESPTANAQPTMSPGTSISFTIMYIIDCMIPQAIGFFPNKKMPTDNSAMGSVQRAKYDRVSWMNPAPTA